MDMVYLHTGPTSVLLEHPDFHLRDAQGKILMTGHWPFPRLNFKSRPLREYLWANMKHWVQDCGADGFRCACSGGVPLDFWQEARTRLETIRPDLVMLAENVSPRDQLQAFDLDYSNWVFACQAVVTRGAPADSLQQWWTKMHDRFPRGARLIYCSVNHDLPRADMVFGERGAQAVSVLNFTLDGVPFLYNGQEIGDATPMDLMAHWKIPWDAAGVPTGGLLKRPFHQRLCRIRRDEPALKAGGNVVWLTNDRPDSVLAYLRRMDQQEILVVVNLSNRAIRAKITLPGKRPATYRNLLTNIYPSPKKSLSTDWIEDGMQAVIRNPHDRVCETESLASTAEEATIDLAGFDYFVGKRQ